MKTTAMPSKPQAETDASPRHTPSTDPPTGAEPTTEGAFAADGVDLTAIRWMLERSPQERLEAAQAFIDAAWVLRRDET